LEWRQGKNVLWKSRLHKLDGAKLKMFYEEGGYKFVSTKIPIFLYKNKNNLNFKTSNNNIIISKYL